MVDWAGSGARPLLALSRALAPGVSFAYVPWGPELPADFPADNGQRTLALAELACQLRPFFPRGTAFIRFDPPWFAREDAGEKKPSLCLPFRRAGADIQPPDTVLIDLTVPAESILAAMKPKWRYNIGLAEKRGVLVKRPGVGGLEIFYTLLKETAARDGIAIHSVDYYRTLFELFGAVPENSGRGLRLYTAEHDGDVLAAIVVLLWGKYATYLYGASSGVKRGLMAPHALQWQAMRDAKASGCSVYDLFGIAPDGDPGHPMAGLYRFKTGFGGQIIHRGGSWDYPYSPALYGIFRAVEAARKKMRDGKKNRPTELRNEAARSAESIS